MRPSVVVLKNVHTDVHCRQYVWCQNFISVSSGANVAGNVHQLSFSGVGYGTSHLHTSSAKIVDLKDAVPCEPLIPASVDTCTAISFLQHESWFIAEPDLPPVLQVPAPYTVAPLDPRKSVLTSQYCAKVRTSGGCIAVFTETVSDFLCRYSSETWDIWCCFTCCHGPVSQVKYPDVTILGCWCVRAVLQANGRYNRYWLKWRHLNAMDFNVI